MPSSSGLLRVRRGGDWLPGEEKGLAASKRAGCLVKCAAKQRVIHWRCYVLGRLMTDAMGHMHGIVVLICVGTKWFSRCGFSCAILCMHEGSTICAPAPPAEDMGDLTWRAALAVVMGFAETAAANAQCDDVLVCASGIFSCGLA